MPLERQVQSLAKNKKLILFIVEGITDETSLSLILSKLIEKDKIVKFELVRTDITTLKGTTSINIINKLSAQVKDFIKSDIYKKGDIEKIIHIVDTDGAFIDESYIEYKDYKIKYTQEKIEVRDVNSIKRRNKQKSEVLSRLISTDSIYTGIPYEIYCFSCNLEHVLHNEQNVHQDDKEKYAYMFEEQFADNPEGFIEFINNPDFAVHKGYKGSWDFIKPIISYENLKISSRSYEKC